VQSSPRDLAARCFVAIVVSGIIAAAVGACGRSGEEPDVASSSPSAEESVTSAQPPAASQVVELKGAQLSAPAGWKVEQAQSSRITISAPKDDLGYSPGFALLDADITLSENTEALAANMLKQPGAKRLTDAEFGGVTFFHVREGNDTNTIDTYGAVIDGSAVTVTWTFLNDLASPKQIDELVNQVMPSFKFEG
jgi:hypothetical protein